MRIATAGARSEQARAVGERLLERLRSEVVIESVAPVNIRGLSICVPHFNDYSTGYDGLAWSRDGGWDEFLKWMTRSWP